MGIFANMYVCFSTRRHPASTRIRSQSDIKSPSDIHSAPPRANEDPPAVRSQVDLRHSLGATPRPRGSIRSQMSSRPQTFIRRIRHGVTCLYMFRFQVDADTGVALCKPPLYSPRRPCSPPSPLPPLPSCHALHFFLPSPCKPPLQMLRRTGNLVTLCKPSLASARLPCRPPPPLPCRPLPRLVDPPVTPPVDPHFNRRRRVTLL